MTDLWWHGPYPLFLSFFHSWRTLRSCCLLNQTSGEGCGIGDVTESLFHRFSLSFLLRGPGFALSLPALGPSVSLSPRFSSPWRARSDSLLSPHARTRAGARPAPHVRTQRQRKITEISARTGHSHLRANLCKLYLIKKKAFIGL